MLQQPSVPIYKARCYDGIKITKWEEQSHPASRSTRTVDHSTRFLFVSVANSVHDDVLRRSLAIWGHNGIDHKGKNYRFLGYTDSQAKAGKLMFLREDNNWTVQRLLESFGDLPAVYLKSGYGKYAARLGLSFSSTVESLDVPHECTIEIPDLLAPDGSLHSDGCGMIRNSFAAQVCKLHDLPPDTTVFQVRRGGIKGLLVCYPDDTFDRHCRKLPQTRIGHYMVAYRPSMFKYKGGPTVLDLNDHSSPPPSARLNLQFTAILLTLGVPFKVFEKLVAEQVALIESISTDREKALGYIKGDLDAATEGGFIQCIYSLLSAGQELSEPWLRHLLRAFQRIQFNALREKMSIRIQDSAYLFGVVDEEGVLGPDEVYVNLPRRTGVLVRDVVVTRNPCYHPGDFRKLRAVDCPSLRHLHNCIVFSATAPHSVPDTIASGDLDGDHYFVCWDPSLIPPREAPPLNRGPCAADAPAPAQHQTRQLSDMPQAAIDTFIQTRKLSELLGKMSNKWKQQVDLTPELADSPYCRALVPLIETALDMVKSGEDFAKLKKQFEALRRSCHARTSKKGNGYQGPIQQLRAMVPQRHKEKLKGLNGLQDEALILRDEDPARWQVYVSEAAKALLKFNQELALAIRDDKECAANFGSASDRRKDRRAPKRTDRVKQDFQSQYFGGEDEDMRYKQRMRASAWYYYGYTKDKSSFAWLGERYLNEIKAWRSLNGNRLPLPEVEAEIHRPIIAPSVPFSQSDSQATRLGQASSRTQQVAMTTEDEVPMDIDSGTIPNQGTPMTQSHELVDCVISISSTPQNSTETRLRRGEHSCSRTTELVERLPGVPITINPRPRAPVATRVRISPTQCSTASHKWRIVSANGTARRYLCACGIEVREKKENGCWVFVLYTISELREPNCASSERARQPQRSRPHPDPEPDEDDHHPHSAGSCSSTVSSLSTAGGFLTPASSFHVNVASTPSPSQSSTPSPSITAVSRVGPLVAENLKPRAPVATPFISRCPSGTTHSWKVWGNQTHRRYTCKDVGCGYVVKERKTGMPEVWVPAY